MLPDFWVGAIISVVASVLACAEPVSPVQPSSRSVFVPSTGNGAFKQIVFDGPALTHPAATGEAVTIFFGRVGTTFVCPGAGPEQVESVDDLPADCASDGAETVTPTRSFAVVTSSEGASAEAIGPNDYYFGWRRFQVRSAHSGIVSVRVALEFSDGATTEDEVLVRFVDPTAFELARERRRGPGTSLPALPGIDHRFCAWVSGELDGTTTPLLVGPESIEARVSGVQATLTQAAAFDPEGWTFGHAPAPYDLPKETRGPHCATLVVEEAGSGTLGLALGALETELEFDTADPRDVVGFELRELEEPAGAQVGNAPDWVAPDEPFFTAMEEDAVESVTLALGENERSFGVVVRLSDGTLALGGRGQLTVGPHGVVELVSPGSTCREPWGCWRLGLQARGTGAGTVTAKLPDGGDFELPIDVVDGGGS